MTLTLFVLHWSPPQMKLCITLLVNAATECVAGLENLFATDPGTDPKSYPAYGQFIPEHEMKAFIRRSGLSPPCRTTTSCICPEEAHSPFTVQRCYGRRKGHTSKGEAGCTATRGSGLWRALLS